jgi:hypothetical protein
MKRMNHVFVGLLDQRHDAVAAQQAKGAAGRFPQDGSGLNGKFHNRSPC